MFFLIGEPFEESLTLLIGGDIKKKLQNDRTQAQIQRTLVVVAAILQAAAMDWSDAVRGIAYFRDAKDMALWDGARQALNLPLQVELVVHADVCRDNLLFELELEASSA